VVSDDREDFGNLDDEARAEALSYMVVGQLVARTRTGGRMRTDHMAELLSIWLNDNGAEADWLDRLHLGTLSEKVALDFAELPRFGDSDSLTQMLTDGRHMDYGCPNVHKIYTACEDELKASYVRLISAVQA
jgi:hypothetical protein